MGHASITVTAHTYADLYDDELDNVASALDALDHRQVDRPSHCTGLHMAFPSLVRGLVDAVHGELVSTIVGWLAEIDAGVQVAREGAHLDSASQKQAVRHLVDLAPRPAVPQVGADEIRTRTWAVDLITIAQPYSTPLADLLAVHGGPEIPACGARCRVQRGCVTSYVKSTPPQGNWRSASRKPSRPQPSADDRKLRPAPRRHAPASASSESRHERCHLHCLPWSSLHH